MKYTWSKFSPTWEGMPFVSQSCMMYNHGTYRCEVFVLPPFKPTEQLFEKHADKGSEEWEIFAWAVRDVMAKFGNFKLCD